LDAGYDPEKEREEEEWAAEAVARLRAKLEAFRDQLPRQERRIFEEHVMHIVPAGPAEAVTAEYVRVLMHRIRERARRLGYRLPE
jgi:hypothetical protein